jgi:hypothetical protein
MYAGTCASIRKAVDVRDKSSAVGIAGSAFKGHSD